MAMSATHLPPLDVSGVQRALDKAIDDAVIGALIRVDDRDGIWTAAAGTAEAGRRAPVDPEGVFRIGSITKTFVATVILQLVDDGAIALDDSVQRHMSGALPDDYPPITVRDLLQHTSGLPNYLPHLLFGTEQIVANRARAWTPDELVAIATAQPRDFEPGTALGYSNTNYVLLGELIRKVTGNWWGDEVDRRVARRLALTSTVAPGDDLSLPGPHAQGYVTLTSRRESGFVNITEYSMSSVDAAGSLISSARDLNAFLGALLGGELLPAPLLEEMLGATDKGVLLDVAGCGLGIMVLSMPDECGCQTVYGSGGGLPGYVSLAFGTRDGQRRVAISFNTAANDPISQAPKLNGLVQLVFCGS